MSTIQPKLTSGLELATLLGADHSEGVQVAIFPAEPTETTLGPEFTYGSGVTGQVVHAVYPTWGPRVLDIVLSNGKGVKWWQVRDYCRQGKLAPVPVDWQGAIVDIPPHFFKKEKTGIRFWNSGPWFWPLELTQFESNLKVLEGFV